MAPTLRHQLTQRQCRKTSQPGSERTRIDRCRWLCVGSHFRAPNWTGFAEAQAVTVEVDTGMFRESFDADRHTRCRRSVGLSCGGEEAPGVITASPGQRRLALWLL